MTDFGSGNRSIPPVMVLEGLISAAAAQFARSSGTTQYSIGDIVCNTGTPVPLEFAGLTPGGIYKVRNGKVRKSSVGLTSATFRLHLWTVAPVTVTNQDNGVFNTSGIADYVGAIDYAAMALAFTDGANASGLPLSGTELVFTAPATGKLFGFLEARATYTPVSVETFDTSITYAPVA